MIEQQAFTQTLDLRQLWSQESVPPALIDVAKRISKCMFDVIVTPDSAVQNVTEWCKKELCWTRAKQTEVKINLTRVLGPLLIDKETDLELQKSSKKEQHIDNGIENQRLVIQLGSAYWAQAREWAIRQAITTPEENGILVVAAAIPRRIPSEKQSWRLIRRLPED